MLDQHEFKLLLVSGMIKCSARCGFLHLQCQVSWERIMPGYPECPNSSIGSIVLGCIYSSPVNARGGVALNLPVPAGLGLRIGSPYALHKDMIPIKESQIPRWHTMLKGCMAAQRNRSLNGTSLRGDWPQTDGDSVLLDWREDASLGRISNLVEFLSDI